MTRIILRASLITLSLLILGLIICGCTGQDSAGQDGAPPAAPASAPAQFALSSTAFADGAEIPVKYTGDGENISPPISWTAPPEGTQELVLICHDPDAPAGDWIHWTVYAIPMEIDSLQEGMPARGVFPSKGGLKQGTNDFGTLGYGGPAPPPGKVHHYHFRLYALDAKTDLVPGIGAADLKKTIARHIVAEAELVGTYSR